MTEEIKIEGTRGDIRKKADYLLDKLHSAELRNLNSDTFIEIKQILDDIKLSGINWNVDVVKSVREKYQILVQTANKILNKETQMEENKNTNESDRMRQLVKSFDEKGTVVRESVTPKADEEKIITEAGRLKTIARIDEYLNNNQFAGTVHFNPGYGQTVNTFLPSSSNSTTTNQKYNPNYTYLQPAEALGLSIKRALESGAPVKDIGFYEEVNWNLNNMGFESKLPIDIKGALIKMLKDNS